MPEPIAPHSPESAAPQHPHGQPRPKVGPGTALKNWAKGIVSVSGRASRSEYWWAAIILGLIPWLLLVLSGMLAVTFGHDEAYPIAYNFDGSVAEYGHHYVLDEGWRITTLVLFGLTLLLALSLITVAVRRLHDANFSGWWWFLALVPPGGLVLLVFCLLPGKPEGVRFDGAFSRRREERTPPRGQ